MQIDSRAHTHRDSSAAGDPPMVPWAFWGGKCPCRATVGWAQATTKWPRPWPRPWKPQESSHVLACFNLYQKYVHLKPLIPSSVEKQYDIIYILQLFETTNGSHCSSQVKFWNCSKATGPTDQFKYIYIYLYNIYIYMTPFQISQARFKKKLHVFKPLMS